MKKTYLKSVVAATFFPTLLWAQSAAAPALATDACFNNQVVTALQLTLLTELRRSVEAGPLYAAAAATGLEACEMQAEAGAITLNYRFKGGSTLSAKQTPALEQSEHSARINATLNDSALSVLMRTERDWFGSEGCGIDWAQSETRTLLDGKAESVFRGPTCNCQAVMRHEGGKPGVDLAFRSAC